MNIPLPVSLDGWRVAPITDVFDINCETLPSATAGDFEFYYLPLEIVSTERIDWSAVQRIKFRDAPSRARRCLKNGDLLIASVRPNLQGFAEFSAVGEGPFVGSTGFIVLSARNSHNPGFYLAQLLSDLGAAQFQAYVTGTNYPAISDRDFERIRVLVPGRLEEERAISIALDLLGEHITATQRAIAAAERLQRALMRELLSGRITADGRKRSSRDFIVHRKLGMIPKGWVVVNASKLAIKITKGQSPKWQGFDYSKDGLLFVTSENVRDGFLDLSNPKFLPIEFNQRIRGSELQKGDLLINLVGASIGRSCLFDSEHAPANINQAVCLFRPRAGVVSRFLLYMFQARETVHRLMSGQVETARANLSLGDVRRLLLVFPEKEVEQQAIADRLDALQNLIRAKEVKITALQRLKKSLMQNLLTGRMRLSPEAIAELTAEAGKSGGA